MHAVKGVLGVEKVCAGTDQLIRDEVMAIVSQDFKRPVVLDIVSSFLKDHVGNIEQDYDRSKLCLQW
jgi:hypothetical protein